MLSAARAPTRRRDVVCADMGVGLGYRKGSFDGAVSVSAVQWLRVRVRVRVRARVSVSVRVRARASTAP